MSVGLMFPNCIIQDMLGTFLGRNGLKNIFACYSRKMEEIKLKKGNLEIKPKKYRSF